MVIDNDDDTIVSKFDDIVRKVQLFVIEDARKDAIPYLMEQAFLLGMEYNNDRRYRTNKQDERSDI